MFGFGRTERLYEARIADLKKEHQRMVEALTAWIEQLQLQVGAPPLQPLPDAHTQPVAPSASLYVSDEESTIREAFDEGLIDEDQLLEGLLRVAEERKIVPGT
jgi:hypothetical protein